MNGEVFCFDAVAPVRERGLKLRRGKRHDYFTSVAPVRERGLKSCGQCLGCRLDKVAPVRERGLKCDHICRYETCQ